MKDVTCFFFSPSENTFFFFRRLVKTLGIVHAVYLKRCGNVRVESTFFLDENLKKYFPADENDFRPLENRLFRLAETASTIIIIGREGNRIERGIIIIIYNLQ